MSVNKLETIGMNVLDHIGDMACLIDKTLAIVWCSPSFSKTYGQGKPVLGQKFVTVCKDFERSVFHDCLQSLIKERQAFHRVGSCPVSKEAVGVRGFFLEKMDLICCHIVKLAENHCLSSYVPLYDPVTSLGNRHSFEKDLSLFLHQKVPFSCILLDIERFSLINQSFGFDAGDQMLMEVSSRLYAERGSGKVFRLNSDQFVYVSTDAEQHQRDAVQLRKAFSQPFLLAGNKYFLTVKSSGYVFKKEQYPTTEDPTHIIQKLEIALRVAKAQNASHVLYSRTMEKDGKRILDVAMALRTAIDTNQLTLHFQPQIRLADSKAFAAEVLVRWEHPEMGTIGPDEFLPVAKECNLNTKLDRWVISQTFNHSRFIQKDFPVDLSINLTSDSLCDRSLVTYVNKMKEQYGVDPGRIIFEVTEDSMMADQQVGYETIAALKAQGFQIAIDDFGVGYSSMSYLMTYPTHYLKLDRSFVDKIVEDNAQQVLVSNMAKMSEALGIKIIVEGVETEEQVKTLIPMGIRYAQGYLYSKPLPLKEYGEFLKTKGKTHLI